MAFFKSSVRSLGSGLSRLVSTGSLPQSGVRILMYHSIGNQFPNDTYGLTVSIDQFEKQVALLKEKCTVVPVKRVDLSAFPESRFRVGVTFDDGFADNFDAAQILDRASVPFTIYVVTSFIGRQHYLSKDQIVKLSGLPNCQIGSHGVSHEKIGKMCDADQIRELSESRRTLEEIIGAPVRTMSYPHGCLSDKTISHAEQAGYELATSSRPGLNRSGKMDWFHLRRSEIQSKDDLAMFESKISGDFDYLRAVYLIRHVTGLSGQYLKAVATRG